MTRREKSIWLAVTALSLMAVIGLCLLALLAGNAAEAAPPAQSNQTRTVDWYYWLDTSNKTIMRARLDGSGVTQTIVTSSEMSTPTDFALDPAGNHVYWTDDGSNQIRRKKADGTGSAQTLTSSNVNQPFRIAVSATNVYWADNGNDTIRRVPIGGGANFLMVSSGISAVSALELSSTHLYWTDSGNDQVRRTTISSPHFTNTLVSSGLSNPVDLAVESDGSHVYVLDRNGASSTIKRVGTSSGSPVTTLVSNTTDTPMDDPIALALDPENDHVYWLDEDDLAVRRAAADGSGGFRTLTAAAGSTPRDLVVSGGGQSVYWLDDNGNDVKHVSAAGGDSDGRGDHRPERSGAHPPRSAQRDNCGFLHHRRRDHRRRLRDPRLGGRDQ